NNPSRSSCSSNVGVHGTAASGTGSVAATSGASMGTSSVSNRSCSDEEPADGLRRRGAGVGGGSAEAERKRRGVGSARSSRVPYPRTDNEAARQRGKDTAG